MADKKKSQELIPKIISAKTDDDAIAILYETLNALYLTSDYTDIVALKDKLEEHKAEFKRITNEFREEEHDYDSVIKYRTDLNFLYRDIQDQLTFDVNRLKIHYEEYKTVQRFESMSSLKDNEEISGKFKAKSASAIRDIIGGDSGYKEYVSLASISYGLWQELGKVLESIRLFTDTLASMAKREMTIDIKDAK